MTREPITNAVEEKCRRHFEAYAKENFTGNHWNLDRCPVKESAIYGKYLWVHVEDAWQAFLAGWNVRKAK